MTTHTAYRKKLIEVDLPLNDINRESARESANTTNHPASLHKWWARRPLTACRAIIFASIVDDPSSCPEEYPTLALQQQQREKLHDIIRRLVVWKNSDDETVLADAKYEIARAIARAMDEPPPSRNEVDTFLRDKAQPIYDPFCGRGSIPIEAQRLGLKAIGADLNPVAVLIAKAVVEIPPKFAGLPPINPEANPIVMNVRRGTKPESVPWSGTYGLGNDIRYYGNWIQEQAKQCIGNIFPKVPLPNGDEKTVMAWLWARTVPCPNPACGVPMPLMKTFQLAKKGPRKYWTRPIFDHREKTVSFVVQENAVGVPREPTVWERSAVCVACDGPVGLDYVGEQARAGNMTYEMTAIVVDDQPGKTFLSPNKEHISTALSAVPEWRPQGRLPDQALGFRVQRYGVTQWHQLFTKRQLVALTKYSDLAKKAREVMISDGASHDYADAVYTYLAVTISKMIQGNCSLSRWRNDTTTVEGPFGRQTVSMLWDFVETNPFSNSGQNWKHHIERTAQTVERVPVSIMSGEVHQADAASSVLPGGGPVIVTDPPYHDQIGYADLSDFFYVWLRPMLREVYPELFGGILTPKAEEIVVVHSRFEDADERFERLLRQSLDLIRQRCAVEFPSSIFYAHKQQEEKRGDRTSTGWETMLSATISAGFEIVGTWPILTELATRQRGQDSNALASSIVLVCRPRPDDAPVATRRQFLDELEGELPRALEQLAQEGHIAPVDLAQAAIGPGMQIYSRYSRVETIAGERVSVREALAAINRVIAEYDEQAQGNLDSESRFCLGWLKQNGYEEGAYGEAEVLAQAMNVSVAELRDFHQLLIASAGSVQLLPPNAFGPPRVAGLEGITAWEGCFSMAYDLDPNHEDGGGVESAATIARAMGSRAESVERLARLLYNHYDRRGDSREAVMFNNLVTEWPNILARAQDSDQGRLV